MGKQSASAHCQKMYRGSKVRPHIARKCIGEVKCVRALVENVPGKQSAPAHCQKMYRGSKVRLHIARKYAGRTKCVCASVENTPGKQSAPAHCPKMCRESKVRLRIGRKHAGKAKCARASVENTPWKPWARFSVLGLDGERDDDEVNAIQKWGGVVLVDVLFSVAGTLFMGKSVEEWGWRVNAGASPARYGKSLTFVV